MEAILIEHLSDILYLVEFYIFTCGMEKLMSTSAGEKLGGVLKK